MSLVSSIYLWGLAALSVPIILHLLKQKPRKKQNFPSFLFLMNTVSVKQRRNRFWKWLVFLLRLVALTCIALAFCLPFLPERAEPVEEAHVCIWDSSMSMTSELYAHDARRFFLDQLQGTDATHVRAVCLASDRAVWHGEEFSGEAAFLQQWFRDSETRLGTSCFEEALRSAEQRLMTVPANSRRITIVTDNQAVPWRNVIREQKLFPGIKLEIQTVESSTPANVAVDSTRIVTAPVPGIRIVELAFTIRNYSGNSMEGDIEVEWNGKTHSFGRVTIPADDILSSSVVLPIEEVKPLGGLLRLVCEDQLQADNLSHFAMAPLPPGKVKLFKPKETELDFVEAVFVGTENSAIVSDLGDWSKAEQNLQVGLAVINRDVDMRIGDLKQLIEKQLANGSTLVLPYASTRKRRALFEYFGFKTNVLSTDGERCFGSIDFDHPLFRPFLDVRVGGLFSVIFNNPPGLSIPEGAATIAYFDNGQPAIVEYPVGNGRLIVLNFSLDNAGGNWPAHASFLPFWHILLQYSSEQRQDVESIDVSSKPASLPPVQSARNLESGEDVPVYGYSVKIFLKHNLLSVMH